jgi:hypothetical protein
MENKFKSWILFIVGLDVQSTFIVYLHFRVHPKHAGAQ